MNRLEKIKESSVFYYLKRHFSKKFESLLKENPGNVFEFSLLSGLYL
jgi:hypothetical protein